MQTLNKDLATLEYILVYYFFVADNHPPPLLIHPPFQIKASRLLQHHLVDIFLKFGSRSRDRWTHSSSFTFSWWYSSCRRLASIRHRWITVENFELQSPGWTASWIAIAPARKRPWRKGVELHHLRCSGAPCSRFFFARLKLHIWNCKL